MEERRNLGDTLDEMLSPEIFVRKMVAFQEDGMRLSLRSQRSRVNFEKWKRPERLIEEMRPSHNKLTPPHDVMQNRQHGSSVIAIK